MKLIVVESPTKARTLSRFLGKDYGVEATMGHIKDLPKSKLHVDVEHNFKPDYQVVVKQEKTISAIKKAAKKAQSIFLATDPDREGEAISAHVEDILKEEKLDKNISRIVFHEITKEAVEDAIAHPRKVDGDLVNAQTARRVLDRLVGYKLSPLLWKKVRRGLSAGRVQSVAVRLIVEKEREIEAFKSEEYWEIFSDVARKKTKKEEFRVALVKIKDKNAQVGKEVEAKKIITDLEKATYVVDEVKKREVNKHPYAPYTTSTMTQAGARVLGWSAKKTMSVAQGLYEEGLITYHRTDSVNIAQSAITKVREFIKTTYGEKYLPEKPRFYKKSSKLAQEAHEAIRPTNVSTKTVTSNSKYAKDASRLYELIWRRFVCCQMATAVYDETTINVKASPHYLLRASGQIVKFDGWRKLFTKDTDEEIVLLPAVEQGEDLKLLKVTGDQKFTQPPARFNEASLIKTLEKLGIGRPSTYAPTISVIQLRNYVEKKDGKFSPTPIGVAVNDFLIKNFKDTFEYEFTAKMEGDLDEIAEGKIDWTRVMKEFWQPFSVKLKDVEKKSERVKIATENTGKKCPECKEGDLVIRIGRFGKFISCSRYPECKHKEKYLETIDMKCPDCKTGEVIIKRTAKRRMFYGCSRYPECDWASWKKPQVSGAETATKTI